MATEAAAPKRRKVAGSGPRGAYASRVCLRCRSKKQKCVLSAAAMEMPNSQDPIAPELRCSRCSEFDADCVLWEDEARLAARRRQGGGRAASAATSQHEPERNNSGGTGGSTSNPSSAQASRHNSINGGGALSSLAAAAAQRLASSSTSSPGPSFTHSNSNSPVQHFSSASSSRLAPVEQQQLQPSGMPRFTSTQASTPYSHSSSPHDAAWNAAQSAGLVGADRAGQAAPAEMTAMQQLLVDNLSVAKTTPLTRRKAFSAATLYSSRPVELLSQLLVRTSGWCSTLDCSGQYDVVASPAALVSEELSRVLEPWVQAHYLWHPDLPSLSHLRAKHVSEPSTASGFLLAVLYHITLPNLSPQPVDAGILTARLASCVRREALAVLVGTPASSWAIHGLMLLHQHDPVALLSPLPAEQQRSTEGITGSGFLSAALSIAKSLQLDQAPSELKQLLSSVGHADDAALTPETRAAVALAVDRVALWTNLHHWRVAMVIEAVEMTMPDELRPEIEDLLQVDVDRYMPMELNDAHHLRKAGRIVLHTRVMMLRRTVLATDQYEFVEKVEDASDHEGRVTTVTRALKESYEHMQRDIAHMKRLLTPLLGVSPGVAVLLQAAGLELQIHNDCLVRASWGFALWGVRTTVWLGRLSGSRDFLDRVSVHSSMGEFSIQHVALRSTQVEQMLLAMTDLACAGTTGLSTSPSDATKAAVAAVPMLQLASFTLHIAKGELDQKAVMMANFRSLRPDTSRHVNLLRFAARCLRDMDPSVRRGDTDTETCIRRGNVRLTAASLVSSMAETMAEWKSLIDGHTVSATDAVGAASSSSSNNAGSPPSPPAAQGSAAPQFATASAFMPEAMAPFAPSSSVGASAQGYDLLDNMLPEPNNWDDLVTDWITMDAGPSQAQDPFDWASIFGFPAMQAPP